MATGAGFTTYAGSLLISAFAAFRYIVRITKPCTSERERFNSDVAYHLEDLSVGFTRGNVSAKVSKDFARKPHPDPEIVRATEARWRQAVEKNPRIFNGTKIRYGGQFEVSEDKKHLTISLWITDYKTFLCSDVGPYSKKLIEDGKRIYGDSRAFMSRKIGVSCLVITADKKIVLIKRSKHVAVDPDLIDCPGGHPEPCNFDWYPDKTMPQHVSKKVVDEIFNSVMAETRDEIGLISTCLSDPILLGGTHYALPRSDLSLALVMYCSLSSEQVKKLYSQGPAEMFESTRVITPTLSSALSWVTRGEEPKINIPKITTGLAGSLKLLSRHLERSTDDVISKRF